MFTAFAIGSIIPVIGVTNSFGDYTELNIYPMPDWLKFCDGSQITDEDSPMYLQYVPDLTASTPIGEATAGTYYPAFSVGNGIYAFGTSFHPETLANNEKQLTIKYHMRIK